MRRRTFSLLFLAALAGACGGRRDSGVNDPSTIPLGQQPVTITLESPSQGALPSGVLGNSVYFAGQEGEQYRVRVTNNTAERLELVVTVDGRDVVSGEIGDYAKQRGYIVEPFGSIVVDGFRQSFDRVAAFRFSGLDSSYTALRGTPQNAGVIGVAVFEEKESKKKAGPLAAGPQPFPTGKDDATASTSTPPAEPAPFRNERGGGRDVARKSAAAESEAPSASPMEEGAVSADAAAPPSATAPGDGGGGQFAPPPVQRNELGTEYGESQFSSVHEVEFKRKKKRKPDAIIAVFYDSERGLAARGVPIGGAFVPDPNAPQPFPRG
jgi:hypothetical protein